MAKPVPDEIMREAWDVAYCICDPVEFKDAHSRATKLIARALMAERLSAESRGRAAQREADARIAERTYAMDAFRFELGTAIATTIRNS